MLVRQKKSHSPLTLLSGTLVATLFGFMSIPMTAYSQRITSTQTVRPMKAVEFCSYASYAQIDDPSGGSGGTSSGGGCSIGQQIVLFDHIGHYLPNACGQYSNQGVGPLHAKPNPTNLTKGYYSANNSAAGGSAAYAVLTRFRTRHQVKLEYVEAVIAQSGPGSYDSIDPRDTTHWPNHVPNYRINIYSGYPAVASDPSIDEPGPGPNIAYYNVPDISQTCFAGGSFELPFNNRLVSSNNGTNTVKQNYLYGFHLNPDHPDSTRQYDDQFQGWADARCDGEQDQQGNVSNAEVVLSGGRQFYLSVMSHFDFQQGMIGGVSSPGNLPPLDLPGPDAIMAWTQNPQMTDISSIDPEGRPRIALMAIGKVTKCCPDIPDPQDLDCNCNLAPEDYPGGESAYQEFCLGGEDSSLGRFTPGLQCDSEDCSQEYEPTAGQTDVAF
ncbi:MAG: hypothetical protein KDD64_11280 [Bdellovibrionales bacterium]|nr:hypothetical protein [Bdellovibrionales bacterium]